VSDLETGLLLAEIALLLGGFAYATSSDLATREVPDGLWQILTAAGLVLGAVAVAPGGVIPTAIWLLVGLFALQHMFAWDSRLGEFGERHANLLEGLLYAAVLLLVVYAVVRLGVGESAVPYAAIALLATLLFARALFEVGVLYGGADAKALMVAGVLVPTFAAAPISPTSAVASVTALLPFAVNLLMDAALASIVIPIALAVRNGARHEFSLRQGFTGYSLPVGELPDRFVWVRDPRVDPARKDDEAMDTSESDRRRRVEIAEELRRKGIDRVWVSPQLPFLVLLTAGALLALLAGNLVLDLLAVL
jgi:archaeal preflagellin peptidase FlaK